MSWPAKHGNQPTWQTPAPTWPPHIHCGRYVEHFHLAFGLAALPAVIAGTVLFGLAALKVCGLAVGSALAAAAVLQSVTGRHFVGPARRAYWLHAAVIGLLLALTLPVSVSWRVPVVGGLLAVGLGKELLGGLGNSLWHPALVGRAAVALLFAAEVAPDSYPFLARGHLVTGSPWATADANPLYHGFELSTPPYGAEAWSMQRPVDVLTHRCYDTAAQHDVAPGALVRLFRDHLPPWPDTIWGSIGGGIGETCLPALLLAGLWLIYRGYARWHLPVSAIAAVAVLAAIWPVQLGPASAQPNSPTTCWFPLLHTEDGLHVGAAVVLFHLTGGGLWLACLLIATDPVSSPLTSRGQIIFGVALGTCIMVIRCSPWYPGLPGAEYWAVLGLSTLVPLIDRIAPRRVLGT